MKKNLLLILIFCSSLASAQTPVKRVLMEEFTTVLCGACPPATYNLNQFHNSNPNTILLTFHEGFGRDSMSNPSTYDVYNLFKPDWGSFAPAIMIDRTVYPTIDSLIPYLSTFTSGYDTLVSNALQQPGYVDIQISTTYNQTANSLLATVTSTFADALPAANYRVNLFLVEDSVSGFGYPGYAQKCYDANFVALHYPGYPYANDTISGYPHRYVVRKSLAGNSFGTAQTTPSLAAVQSPALNTPFVFTMSSPFLIPAHYNIDRLYLVASVNQYVAGSQSENFVINANVGKFTDLISTGVATLNSEVPVELYPNPSSGIFNLNIEKIHTDNLNVEVCDMMGRIVYENSFSDISQVTSLQLDLNELSDGIYSLSYKSTNLHGSIGFVISK
ncbi:MAG TPA: T9SS type A sorting domain-containing protein [Bacteroidia bacterium]|nr:T9SS type A sorting domain-containing protein [Bacteroidia bacterium]